MISLIIAFTFGFVSAALLAYLNVLQGFKKYQEEAKEKLQFYTQQHSIAKMKYEQMKAMSHNLLTPLHGVRGSADILYGTELNDNQKSIAKDITEKANEIFSYLRGVCHFEDNQEVVEEITEFPSANILLVEDDPLNQKIATSYLKKVEVQPDLAKTGKEAIEMVQKKNYDIVIMDLSMPDVDGIEATRHIRKLPQIPKSLVIIGFTANSSHECREACLFAGMNDYMTKPATAQQILHCLQKWLPQSATLRSRKSTQQISIDQSVKALEKAFEEQNFTEIRSQTENIISFCNELELDSLKKTAEELLKIAESQNMSGGLQCFFDLKHSLQFIGKLTQTDSKKSA